MDFFKTKSFEGEGQFEIPQEKNVDMTTFASSMTELEESKLEEPQYSEAEKQEIGQRILSGSMLNQTSERGRHVFADYSSQNVSSRIEASAKQSVSDLLDSKVSYVEATKAATVQDHEAQLDELKKLAGHYSDNSFKKRKSQLENATAIFKEIDKKRTEADNTQDPYEQLKLRIEIVDMKTKALTLRAKAFGKDPTVVNDEIANIAIAANYEKIELASRVANSTSDAGEAKALRTNKHDRILNEISGNAHLNIEKIAEKRRSHAQLDAYNAAYKARLAEMKDRDSQGRVKADVERNAKQHDKGMQYVSSIEESMQGDNESIDKLSEKPVAKKALASLTNTLTIKGKITGLIDDMKRCLVRMKDGEPVIQKTRLDLDRQVEDIVAMCDKFLTENKDMESKGSDCETACYKYVKELKEKLTVPAEKGGIFASGLSSIQRILTDYRVHAAFSSKGIRDESIEVDKKEQKRKTGKDSVADGAEVFKDKKLESIFGKADDDISVSELRKKSKGIEATVDVEKAVKLEELKLLNPQKDVTWEHADAAVTVDALLRVRGITLKNGPMDIMAAIPAEARTFQQILDHYGKLASGGSALAESKDLISKYLDSEKYSVVHAEFTHSDMTDMTEDEQDAEYNRVFISIESEIERAITNGSAAGVFDSNTGKYFVVNGYDNKTRTFKILDGEESKEVSEQDMFNNLIGQNQVISIEWIKFRQAPGGEDEAYVVPLNDRIFAQKQRADSVDNSKKTIDEKATEYAKKYTDLMDRHAGNKDAEDLFGKIKPLFDTFAALNKYIQDSIASTNEVVGFRGNILQMMAKIVVNKEEYLNALGSELNLFEEEYETEVRNIVVDITDYILDAKTIHIIDEMDLAIRERNHNLKDEDELEPVLEDEDCLEYIDAYIAKEKAEPVLDETKEKIDATSKAYEELNKSSLVSDNSQDMARVRAIKEMTDIITEIKGIDFIEDANITSCFEYAKKLDVLIQNISQACSDYISEKGNIEELDEMAKSCYEYVDSIKSIVCEKEFADSIGKIKKYIVDVANSKKRIEENEKARIEKLLKANAVEDLQEEEKEEEQKEEKEEEQKEEKKEQKKEKKEEEKEEEQKKEEGKDKSMEEGAAGEEKVEEQINAQETETTEETQEETKKVDSKEIDFSDFLVSDYVPVFNEGYTEAEIQKQKDDHCYDAFRDVRLQNEMQLKLDAFTAKLDELLSDYIDRYINTEELTEKNFKTETDYVLIQGKMEELKMVMKVFESRIKGSGSKLLPEYKEIRKQYIEPMLAIAAKAIADKEYIDSIDATLTERLTELDNLVGRYNANHFEAIKADRTKQRKKSKTVNSMDKDAEEFFDEVRDNMLTEAAKENVQDDMTPEERLARTNRRIRSILKNDEFEFVRGTKEKRLLYSNIVKNRQLEYEKVNTELSQLTVGEQKNNNCWACSLDVLLRSRGYALKGGEKGVMKYLPDRIRTIREAADYYGLVGNANYSIAEQSELIEKIVDKDKYSLVHNEYTEYGDRKALQQSVNRMLSEIKMGIGNGSAVALRNPTAAHFITIVEADDNHIVYLDSNSKKADKREVVKDPHAFLSRMLRGQRMVTLDWLVDIDAAKTVSLDVTTETKSESTKAGQSPKEKKVTTYMGKKLSDYASERVENGKITLFDYVKENLITGTEKSLTH